MLICLCVHASGTFAVRLCSEVCLFVVGVAPAARCSIPAVYHMLGVCILAEGVQQADQRLLSRAKTGVYVSVWNYWTRFLLRVGNRAKSRKYRYTAWNLTLTKLNELGMGREAGNIWYYAPVYQYCCTVKWQKYNRFQHPGKRPQDQENRVPDTGR